LDARGSVWLCAAGERLSESGPRAWCGCAQSTGGHHGAGSGCGSGCVVRAVPAWALRDETMLGPFFIFWRILVVSLFGKAREGRRWSVSASEASAGWVERGRNVSRGTGHANVVGRARLGVAAWHRAENDITMEQWVSGVVMLAVGSRRGRRKRRCAWNRSVESGAVRVCAGCAGCAGGPREAGREGRSEGQDGRVRSVRSGRGQDGKNCASGRTRDAPCEARAMSVLRGPWLRSEHHQRQRRGLDSTRRMARLRACVRARLLACLLACLPACLLPTRYSAAHREQPLSTPQSRVL
jgi:hypothetical protein